MVVLIDIPAEPSKFAVPTTSPVSAIALAVASAVAVEALPVTAPSMFATNVAVEYPVPPVLTIVVGSTSNNSNNLYLPLSF